ncbi:calmodulin [Pseudoalteromonas aurantia]|uniref:EF-hand domain-containing protein n=1 Tax=Pseudoalteromonas aurantia TaxID=43654 RepID=UPI00110BCCE6|nr:EF-hand domain-containing protein [Pseudoalteromonas aurantia]TMO60453.1 calmodulin [Pseudoalteromonas aurantia]
MYMTVILLSGAVGLFSQPQTGKLAVQQLDTNSDGVISWSESKQLPRLMAQFKDLDVDNSGVISRAEFD